ncbi:hypothetical protein GCM10009863_29420 [Streptomyces axinellae]|uniref:Uncharacterized protein n=1 Tax=Streptomyces axinellae TaxID=552788 RepID=A0ABN3Q6E8_9ACTN
MGVSWLNPPGHADPRAPPPSHMGRGTRRPWPGSGEGNCSCLDGLFRCPAPVTGSAESPCPYV